MIENAAVQGARYLDDLRSIRANTIRDVRGRGLMLALHPKQAMHVAIVRRCGAEASWLRTRMITRSVSPRRW
jgi:4-aminobutyrate aminotransferase-like enzyme